MKLLIGLIIAFGVGAACRWFDIPAPAPPALQGALLVVAMTSGYLAADRLKKPPPAPPAPALVTPSHPSSPNRTQAASSANAGE